jgi:hypothetical protein
MPALFGGEAGKDWQADGRLIEMVQVCQIFGFAFNNVCVCQTFLQWNVCVKLGDIPYHMDDYPLKNI